ncbi:hypothetical protein RJT34_09224 [Clitoria ternatea]|uniref:Uncharacterized protein n=1 Tax=Clitoria ternatea TaxID=43366 RepID=A0AAN9K734_CLITE
MQKGIQRQTSLREKLKSSLICCFSVHQDEDGEGGFYSKLRIPKMPISPVGSTISSPLLWFKTAAKSPPGGETGGGGDHNIFPRVRGRSLRARMGRKMHSQHRQSQSADFSYDPSSYALNFESETHEDQFPIRNFSSRLPASPPPIKYSDEIAVCS